LLFRYGKKFTSDTDLVKDTIQDLFFDLIRTRENLGETNNIRFYLMRSFRRRLVVNLKKSEPRFGKDFYDVHPAIEYSIEDNLIGQEFQSESNRFVHNCLKELNPRQREILFYRFTCNFSYDEICELMSLKYDSARKLAFRAIESLRKMADEFVFLDQ
jgi:RNA polymerase sigma factor (sigma-70 family)